MSASASAKPTSLFPSVASSSSSAAAYTPIQQQQRASSPMTVSSPQHTHLLNTPTSINQRPHHLPSPPETFPHSTEAPMALTSNASMMPAAPQSSITPGFLPAPAHHHHAPGQAANTQEGIQQLLGGVPGANTPFANFATSYLSNNIGAAEGFVSSRLNSWVPVDSLRYYFNVNNSYVLNKIGRILFPFGPRNRRWARTITRSDNGIVVYLPPRDDINAPDLYIPLMAFITYVLIVGFAMGTAGEFTPEILASTFSSGVVTLLLHLLILKAGLYILPNSSACSFFDLIAYHGYTYVGVVLTSLTVIFLPEWVQWLTWLVTSLCMAKFMVETFKLIIERDTNETSNPSFRRNYFLLSTGLLQFVLSYFLTNI